MSSPETIRASIPVMPILEGAGDDIIESVSVSEAGVPSASTPAPPLPPPQPAPTLPPPGAEPGPTPEAPSEPATATEEHVPFKWKGQARQVPIGVLDALGNAIGATSREATLNWLQQGRDIDFQSAKVREEREQLKAERDQMNNERIEIQQAFRRLESMLPQNQNPYTPPGVPGYGAPTLPPTVPGGYAAPAPPYANPGGMGPLPGGYPPVAPPSWTLPQDPGERDRYVLQALLSIPQQVQHAVGPVLQEIRADRDRQTRAMVASQAMHEQSQLEQLATAYVTKLQNDGWPIPEGLDGNVLIHDMNEMGLSANPNMPWTRALEIAAATRLWQLGPQVGSANTINEAETNREATWRVPPTKARPIPSPQVKSRLEAARNLGDSVSVREAIGNA